MELYQFILGIAGIILSDFLIRLLLIRTTKKQENVKADNAAIDGMKSATADLREDNTRLREQLEHERARNEQLEAQKDARINQLLDDKDLEREGRVTAEQGYCRHFGCVLREPAIGQGREWIEAHRNDPAMGVDYLPINQLLTKYGFDKRKKKEEANDDKTEN